MHEVCGSTVSNRHSNAPSTVPLIRRGLTFYWRTHVAVALGVAAAGAALTGALVVGDSMRLSLRAVALSRLDGIDQVLTGPRFFRQSLADALNARPAFARDHGTAVAAIRLTAGVTDVASGSAARNVQLWGVDDRFWNLGTPSATQTPADLGRDLLINEPLARELGIQPGQDLLLRVARVIEVSPETLLGRRDDRVLTRRVTVRAVIPAEGLARLGLDHTQAEPRNAFVALSTLQRWLEQPNRVNTLLVGSGAAAPAAALQAHLDAVVGLEDLGLRLRRDRRQRYTSLESDALLLPPVVESAAYEAAAALHLRVGALLSYLADSISGSPAGSGSRDIPYSVISALDDPALAISNLRDTDGNPITHLEPGTLRPNSWAAAALLPAPSVILTYRVAGRFGQLETRRTEFRAEPAVALEVGGDPGFTPEYHGVTDAATLADWDPPFPVDLQRIDDTDEDYWRRYRTTPKAFVSLADGTRLWAANPERFGRVTALWIPGVQEDIAGPFEDAVLQRLSGASLGLTFSAVRQQALQAATGSTDFGGLFIGFSGFVILSAAMLVALLFRLGVERRAGESGILLAIGYSPLQVARLFLGEGLVLAVAGTAVGLPASIAYAALMVQGLRSWWSQAVEAPFLQLHVTALTLIIGGAATIAVAAVSIALAWRGLGRHSTRSLLAGGGSLVLGQRAAGPRSAFGWPTLVPAALATFAALLPLGVPAVPEAISFFASGALMLVAVLVWVRRRLRAAPLRLISEPGLWAMVRLGLRNAPRHPGRSTQTIGLLASAVFIIVAVQAFRIEAPSDNGDRGGASGGFRLVAETAVPLLFDLNAPAGWSAAGLSSATGAALQEVTLMPFRLRPGDSASCRNLYLPTHHRIIGAVPDMIERGGFEFAAVQPGAAGNPWRLLDHAFDDGAIAAIGDESAVKWQLHSGLGKDLAITDDQGRRRTLRFVGLLKGSILQDELIVAESAFTQLFPNRSGYGFFLVATPPGRAREVSDLLERELATYGFDAQTARDRLAGYIAIQNTYLSVFQALGGFGLILGTVGLTAVLLRNVWERRGELALMRAVGFDSRALGTMVLTENLLLVVAGLLCGLLPALIAVAPHIVRRPHALPWASTAGMLAAVLVVAAGAAGLALRPTLRAHLIPALRRE